MGIEVSERDALPEAQEARPRPADDAARLCAVVAALSVQAVACRTVLEARERELAACRRELEAAQATAAAAAEALEAVQRSTCWRMTAPLRRVLAGAPGLARTGRRAARLANWALTGRLLAELRRHAAWRRDAAALSREGGFDAAWYAARYPDVARSGLSPLWHYVTIGRAEGRDARPSG